MKNLFVFLFVMFTMTISAQEIKTHTVQRGETIESIAEKYNVSAADITKANPDAAKFFYTGMKLKIPAVHNNKINEPVNAENRAVVNPPTKQIEVGTEQNNNQSSSVMPSEPTMSPNGQLIDGLEVFFKFNPTHDFYGFRITGICPKDNLKWLGLSFGADYQFIKHGSFFSDFGVGFFPRYVISSLMLGCSLYPYIGLYSYDKLAGFYNYTGNAKYESKTEFTYGLNFDFLVGVKLFTTKKMNNYYLVGGYEVKAHEFEFEGAFKGGKWMVGLHIQY